MEKSPLKEVLQFGNYERPDTLPRWRRHDWLGPLFPNVPQGIEVRSFLYTNTERANPDQKALISADDIAQFDAGEVFFLVFGRVSYSDVFGHRHWTDFCKIFLGKEIPLLTNAIVQCNEHNDVDNNDGRL